MNSLSVLFWDRFNLPIFWGNCSNLQLMRIVLTIWISDCLCLAHIASQNQDEFTVSFISRQKFIFLFFEEAVWIWRLCKFSFSFGLQLWCAGSIYKKVFISGSKFLSPSMKALVGTSPCATSLGHLDFRLFSFGLYSRNQDEFTVSIISRWKFISLFFEEAVRILSLCDSSWSFKLQSGNILL